MPRYRLVETYRAPWGVLTAGTILDTDAPPGSLFAMDKDLAEALVNDGTAQIEPPLRKRQSDRAWAKAEQQRRE